MFVKIVSRMVVCVSVFVLGGVLSMMPSVFTVQGAQPGQRQYFGSRSEVIFPSPVDADKGLRLCIDTSNDRVYLLIHAGNKHALIQAAKQINEFSREELELENTSFSFLYHGELKKHQFQSRDGITKLYLGRLEKIENQRIEVSSP